MTTIKSKRIFEIIPGVLSWSLILGLLILLVVNPPMTALALILYLIYWAIRFSYMTLLLLLANKRFRSFRDMQWCDLCAETKSDIALEDIIHIVLYPIYKERKEIIEESVSALQNVCYSKKNIIVVLAGEERDADSHAKLHAVKQKYDGIFKDIVITIHPQEVEGEIPCKGANATFAARLMTTYCHEHNYDVNTIIISCFDSDTQPDKEYFGCLSYHFITNQSRHRTSYQPFPVYSNNIYEASAFARIVEIGSTFWQLIESMKFEKFITFSSHSMSFKTLIEVGYWPVDMISDDSVIFWKCFLHFDGKYETYPLEVPVHMDIAVGQNMWDTIVVQYKQKRRWAWGVENFAFLCIGLLEHKKIRLREKVTRVWQLLDNHVQWATWAIIISFITPCVILWARVTLQEDLVLFNLSYINATISHVLLIIMVLCIIMGKQFLPPRPKGVGRGFYISYILQWALLPFVSALLGSIPALDAQTRMMFGKYLVFNRTPKARRETETAQTGLTHDVSDEQ